MRKEGRAKGRSREQIRKEEESRRGKNDVKESGRKERKRKEEVTRE